jgi:hypothetical protein
MKCSFAFLQHLKRITVTYEAKKEENNHETSFIAQK